MYLNILHISGRKSLIIDTLEHGTERQAKDDLEALVDTTPVGVVVFDAQGRNLKAVNQETRRIAGNVHVPSRSLDELHKLLTFRQTDGREIPRDDLPLAQVLGSGQTVRAQEIVIENPTGRKVSTLVNATPILAEDGRVTSVVATIQDLTPLEELDRLRTEFLSTVGHSFRHPLATIKGSASAVLNTSPSIDAAEMRHFMRMVDTQADRMLELLGNLLDATRMDSGSLELAPSPTDLREVLEPAKNAFHRKGHRNPIALDLPADLPRVEVDTERLAQALTSLLATSATLADEEEATVHVSAHTQEGFAWMTVWTESQRPLPQERLTTLFRRGPHPDLTTANGDQPATGLALAICRGIVEAHGGRVWAENAEEGTRFTLTVPTAETPADPQNHADSGDRPSARILVLEGDPQTLKLAGNTLRQAGYRSTLISNPEKLDEAVARERPGIVLLDLAMPGTDPFHMARTVRENSRAKVIFLSAGGTDEELKRAFDAGATDYLIKPFSPVELTARLRGALRTTAPGPEEPENRTLTVHDLTMDYARRQATIGGHPLELTPTEYRLLEELATNAGKLMTKEELLQRVWGPGYTRDHQLLRTFIKTLRKKLGSHPNSPAYITTQHRAGYRMNSS